MKTILISFLTIALFSGAYAGTAVTEVEARQELAKTVKRIITDEMSLYKNYFYDREITSMKEKVEITCLVNDKNNVELVRVKCPNCDAKDFINYIFKENQIKAHSVLVGKIFRVNVELRYKAW
ncbi:MAG: hypothetical protein AB2L24_18180 [Mangrovibacterium sp.]|jgi:hypothetical protein